MMKSNSTHIVVQGNQIKAQIATAFMMNSNTSIKRASKRILQDDQESDSSQSNKMPCLTRKIQDIVSDRQILSGSSANASATDDSNDSIQFNSQSSMGLNLAGVNMSPVHGHDSHMNANFSQPSAGSRLLVMGDVATTLAMDRINYSNGSTANLMPNGAINAVIAE